MSSAPILPAPATSPIPSSRSSAETRLSSAVETFRRHDDLPVDWHVENGLVGYDDAVATMEQRAEAIARGDAGEQVWLVEHPALFTAGTGAAILPEPSRFPVHRTGRGGKLTYHGPGQRVAYVMLDLNARSRDVRRYVTALEHWIMETLAAFAIRGERRETRVGVWVTRPEKAHGRDGAIAEDKIAAIGIRLRRWVGFHGIAINVDPDLSHYAGIIPCGIAEAHLGVTSLADLGRIVSMAEVDIALRDAFETIFGPTRRG